MIFAPIFSWLWIKLSNMNREPAAPYKFGFGLVLLGLGFLALNVGGGSASAGMIPAIFMVFLYLLHTIGELTLSPVGLSLVTKLSPRHMVGFLMGIWLLSSSLAHQGGKHIAKLTTVNEKTIVESESFKKAKMDEDIKALLISDKYKDKLEDASVEDVLTDSSFIADLNIKSDKDYAKSTVYIKESLDEAKNYKGTKKEKMLKAAKVEFISYSDKAVTSDTISEGELAKLSKNTPGTAVINAIRSESLNKDLVFSNYLVLLLLLVDFYYLLLESQSKNGCTASTNFSYYSKGCYWQPFLFLIHSKNENILYILYYFI